MRESEAEVLARIESTRDHMGETMEQIGERMNPDRVQEELKARARNQVNEVKETMKYRARSAMRDMEDGMNDAGRGLWATIRENPIPAGMVGVGMAWLMANGRGSSHDREHYAAAYGTNVRSAGYTGYAGRGGTYSAGGYPTTRGYEGTARGYEAGPMDRSVELDAAADMDRSTGETARERMGGAAETAKHRASEAADEAGERASEAVDEARERASEMADSAKERTADMADTARERASHMAGSAKHRASELSHRASHRMDEAQHRAGEAARHMGRRAQRVERRVEHAVQDNPLAAGAIAAALGLAAGLMIPESRREHEMMGEARDKMMRNAGQTVRRAGEKARDVARETASESAKQAVDQMMPGGGEGEAMNEPGR